MAKKYIVFGLLILAIGAAAIFAASKADSMAIVSGFRKTIDTAAEKLGILGEGESFWTVVDEDAILEDVRKSTAGSDGVEDVTFKEPDEPETPESAAAPDTEEQESTVHEAEEDEIIELQYEGGNVSVSGGVGSSETIAEIMSEVEETQEQPDDQLMSETEETQEKPGDPSEVKYNEYMAMSAEEREEFRSRWDSSQAFTRWYTDMIFEHENDGSIVRKNLGGDASEDVEQLESEAARRR